MPIGEKFLKKVAEHKANAIVWAEQLYHYRLISRAIGITEDTLKNYRTKDEQFSEQLEQARTRFLNKKMKIAKPEFLLERLEPEVFGQKNQTNINIIMPQPLLGGETRKQVDSDTEVKVINDKEN